MAEALPDSPTDETQPGMTPVQASRHWQLQLQMADRAVKDWHDYADKVEKRYRASKDGVNAKRGAGKRSFAILYSNTETLKASLYAKTPKPDVRRRFADRNPVSRTAAEILERTLSYCGDTSAHDRAYRAGVHDMCLPGRGVVWHVYEAETQQVPQIDPMTQQPVVGMGHNGGPEMVDRIAKQDIREEYVYWRDFRWEPARCWMDCNWVARRHRMTRSDLRDNGFEDADEVPLNWSADESTQPGKDVADDLKRAEVWEIWCKRTKSRYWIVKGFTKALRIDPDPYELENFFPCCEPLSAILGTDSYVPVPFYSQYEDQAEDLDELTARISALVKAMKRRGVYDASIPELKRLARAGDNEFIGVDGQKYALMVQNSKNGVSAAFSTEDISGIAEVLIGLHDQRDRLVRAIYEVSGISDIIRGESNPSETATAQRIKAQVGSMRVKDAQHAVQVWVRDNYRIKAELAAQNFTPEKFAAITGMPVDENFAAAIQILKSDERRSYQVDIETDSTVFEDAEAEKNARVELLTAMAGFMQQALPVVQAVPEMTKLVGEMLSFGVRGHKVGKGLEDIIDQTMEDIEKKQQQMAANPPANPEMEKIKAEMEASQQAHQLDMAGKQADQQAAQVKMQADMTAKQADHQLKQEAQIQDLQMQREKMAMELQAMREKMMMEREAREIELQFKEREHRMALEQSAQMNEHKLEAAKEAAKVKAANAGGDSNGRAH